MIRPRELSLTVKEARTLGRTLFGQQMWCFGCDVKHPVGNLLVLRGFDKTTPPPGITAPSRYRLEGDGMCLTLWGFGVLYREEGVGTLYLRRRDFSPRLHSEGVDTEDIWRVSEMPGGRMPRSETARRTACRLMAGACRWLSDYEAWVADECGSDYRRKCLAAQEKRAIPAEEICGAWSELAEHFEIEGENIV